MSQALMELMEPEIRQRENEALQKGRQEGRREARKDIIDILRNCGYNDEEITNIIKKQYNLSDYEAENFLVGEDV